MLPPFRMTNSCIPLQLRLPTLFIVVASFVVGVDAFLAPSTQCWLGKQVVVASASQSALDSTTQNEEPVTQRIRAAVFQALAISSSNSENPLAILTQVADSLRVASQHGVDVVLFPELFLNDGSKRPIDRESYELNIVGNICGELNVACVLGYSERIHESELKNIDDPDGNMNGAYNSIAAFHASGSRAGNYRCISTNNSAKGDFIRGVTFVECIPTVLQLPSVQEEQREIKIGLICGNDALSPEHCRQLVRSSAQAIFAPTSLRNDEHDLRLAKCVIPTRAMENQVPFLFANYAQQQQENNGEESDFIGSSAILSLDGSYLVCAPQEEGGEMPCDSGYLMPCEGGTLYAADIDIVLNESGSSSLIQQSMEQWDLNPRIPDGLGEQINTQEHRETKGFGASSRRRASKARKLK